MTVGVMRNPQLTLRKLIMKNITKTILLSLLLTVAGVASAQDYSGYRYDSNTAQQMQSVTIGRVEAMREVTVDGTSQLAQYTGSGLGAALGGILGSTLGNNQATRAAAAITLGAAGAIGGNYATKAINREVAYEYIIQLNDGRTVAVTQSYESNNAILVGDKVRILQSGRVRIVKMI
jgi:outer membrane lipoprotein SlyB